MQMQLVVATLSKFLAIQTFRMKHKSSRLINCYVLFTVHISIILGNDQLDIQLLYFTTRLLWSSTCFEHYMLIIRRLNCIDAASGIVTLKISEWSKITSVTFAAKHPRCCQPTGWQHRGCIAANYTLVILDHSLILRVTIPDAASIQFNLLMMSI